MDKLFYENLYIEKGARCICGVDEVGRGPLAGPVTVCAVIMDLSKIVDGVDDSKKLSEKKREKLFPQIREAAVDMSIVSVGPEVIDEINILNATKQAMQQAIMSLKVKPDGDVCFIEVKSRTTYSYGYALEAVTPAKIARYKRFINLYTQIHRLYDKTLRIDVIAISGDDVEHIENVGG